MLNETQNIITRMSQSGMRSLFRCCHSPEQRRELIARKAYSLAENRGFAAGKELDDWLAAEREVDLFLEGEHYCGD